MIFDASAAGRNRVDYAGHIAGGQARAYCGVRATAVARTITLFRESVTGTNAREQRLARGRPIDATLNAGIGRIPAIDLVTGVCRWDAGIGRLYLRSWGAFDIQTTDGQGEQQHARQWRPTAGPLRRYDSYHSVYPSPESSVNVRSGNTSGAGF